MAKIDNPQPSAKAQSHTHGKTSFIFVFAKGATNRGLNTRAFGYVYLARHFVLCFMIKQRNEHFGLASFIPRRSTRKTERECVWMTSGFQEVSSADFLSDPQTHRQSQMSRLEKLVYSFIPPPPSPASPQEQQKDMNMLEMNTRVCAVWDRAFLPTIVGSGEGGRL